MNRRKEKFLNYVNYRKIASFKLKFNFEKPDDTLIL